MKELQRSELYQPQTVSQGFNPSRAADVTPLLRENQQRQLNEQKMLSEAVMQDMRAQAKMGEYRAALETREAQQLAQFSETLFDQVKEVAQTRIDNERAEAAALFYEDVASVQQTEATYDAIRQQLNNQRDSDAEIAASAFQNGTPYEVVKRFRALSGHAQAAYAEQMALNAGSLYEEYQSNQLATNTNTIEISGNPVVINNPSNLAEFSGVRAFTRKEFIKELGISNMAPGLQAKAFKAMYEVDAKLDNEFETSYNVTQGANDREEFFEQWKEGSITTEQLITNVNATPGKDGKGKFPFADIHKKIVEEAAELSLKDPIRANQLMAAYGEVELNGRKFKDIHGDKINKYRELAEDKQYAAWQAYDRNGKRQLDAFVDQAQRLAANNPEFTLEDVEQLGKDYLQLAASVGQDAKIPREIMELWTNFSAGAERIDQMMKIQENRKNAFALDPDEIKKLPQEVKDKYLKEAEAQAKARMGDLKTFDDTLKAIVNKHPQVMASTGLEGRGLSPLIIADLQKELRDDITRGLKADPQADADQLGRDSVKRLSDEFSAGLNDPNSKYFFGETGNLFPRYFGETKENHGDATSRQLGFVKKRKYLTERVAREGINVLDDKLLIADTESQLAKQRQHYLRTGALPPAAITLASRYNWDPFEVFNRQLEGNDLDAIETFRDVQSQTTDTFNTLKMLQRGEGNQQMLQRLTNDRWPVRSSLAQYVPTKGGLQGLTEQDFIDLAYAVSGEAARDTEDEYAVAASILNRVADPNFKGNTVKEVITAEGQYEAYWKGGMRHEPELVKKLMSPEGQRQIIGMLYRLQGRTDFKGVTQRHNMGPGDVLADPNGNFFHYAGQTVGSGPYTGEKPTHYMRFISNE